MEEFADRFTIRYRKVLRQVATEYTPEEIRENKESKDSLIKRFVIFMYS
jgi:TRAP-type C4-dicarboxylate transport system substrate-binding protein